MSCNCNKCSNFSTVGTAAVVSTNLQLTPDTALSPVNQGRVCFVLTTSVPTAGLILPVTIVLDGTAVPVYDQYGNILYGSVLRTRKVIRGYYGTNGSGATAHLQLVHYPGNCFCNS